MKIRNRIGFHFGSNSYATGYGDYIRALDQAGIPATVMSVGGEGLGDIISQWDNGSTVEHTAVVRCLSHNDVPLYDYPIDTAVADWLARYIPKIGPDVKKYHQRIITKHGNELDKNKIQWLADFYTALHPALLQAMGWTNHRICVFNFASGEPDYDDWESILPFLKLAGENPDKFVIGVHEYSYSMADIFNAYPYLVGRCWSHLYDVCDKHSIHRPDIAIHEFGWRDIDAPDPSLAMKHVDGAMRMYAEKCGDNFLGAGIWTLQAWQDSGINRKIQKLIAPVTQLSLSQWYDAPDEVIPPDPPVEPPPQNGRKVTVLLTPQFSKMDDEQTAVCYDYQQNGFPIGDTMTSGEHTLTPSHDDAFDLYTAGNVGSNLGIVYPQVSGFTREWIEANYPSVLDPDKNLVFLENEPPPAPPPIEDTLQYGDVICDISSAQGDMNMQRLIDYGIVKRFIIRVSSGKRYSSTDEFGIDLQFWQNAAKAIQIGLPVDAYMFLNNEEPYQEQADRFYLALSTAMSAGLDVRAVGFDVEGDFSPQTESEIKQALTVMKNGNNLCDVSMIYSGAWWWNKKVARTSTWPHDMGFKQWAAYYYNADGVPLPSFPPVNSIWSGLNGFQKSDTRYWQFTSTGGYLVGHTTYKLDLNYYMENQDAPPPIEPPPPAVEKIDVLPYLRGTDKIQFDMDYGTGTQTTQVRHYPTRWIYVKGEPGQYECFFLGNYNGEEWIFRAEDTSESMTRLYAHFMSNGGAIGAPWVPRFMEVGIYYRTPKFVQHYDKAMSGGVWTGGCTKSNGGDVVDRIRLVSRPYTKTYRSGKSLQVITLEWASGEQYDYSQQFGNVGFRDAMREFWFMEGPLLGRQDKTYIKPTCFNVGW